jgi:hypothetical protein
MSPRGPTLGRRHRNPPSTHTSSNTSSDTATTGCPNTRTMKTGTGIPTPHLCPRCDRVTWCLGSNSLVSSSLPFVFPFSVFPHSNISTSPPLLQTLPRDALPTARDDHNPHTTTQYPTPTYVLPSSPTPISLTRNCSHSNQLSHVTALKSHKSTSNNAYDNDNKCHVNRPKPNPDELLKLLELKHMYEKWGYGPHRLEHKINWIYNTNRELRDGTQHPTQPENELRESECRQPPTALHNLNPAYPSAHTAPTYLEDKPDNMSDTYKEFGIETDEHEPWEFGDPPSKTPFYSHLSVYCTCCQPDSQVDNLLSEMGHPTPADALFHMDWLTILLYPLLMGWLVISSTHCVWVGQLVLYTYWPVV